MGLDTQSHHLVNGSRKRRARHSQSCSKKEEETEKETAISLDERERECLCVCVSERKRQVKSVCLFSLLSSLTLTNTAKQLEKGEESEHDYERTHEPMYR